MNSPIGRRSRSRSIPRPLISSSAATSAGSAATRCGRCRPRSAPAAQTALTNALLEELDQRGAAAAADEQVVSPAEVLTAVLAPLLPGQEPPGRPAIPLSENDLLVNSRDEPAIGHELQRELQSADRVDILIAFVKWYGVRILRDELASLRDRGVPLRVLTITYLGTTERKALD